MDFCLSNPITIVQFKINAKSITIVKDQMSSNYLQVFISKLVSSFVGTFLFLNRNKCDFVLIYDILCFLVSLSMMSF